MKQRGHSEMLGRVFFNKIIPYDSNFLLLSYIATQRGTMDDTDKNGVDRWTDGRTGEAETERRPGYGHCITYYIVHQLTIG